MTRANFIAVVLIAMCYENKKPRFDDHENLIQMAAEFDLHWVNAAQKYSALKYHRLKVLAGRVVQDCAYTKPASCACSSLDLICSICDMGAS